jgi:hypothetical protein
MSLEISSAISEQNRAFVFRLNKRLGNPIPEPLLRKQLESNEPFLVARLILRTHSELQKPQSAKRRDKLTKFDRFIIWLKKFSRSSST